MQYHPRRTERRLPAVPIHPRTKERAALPGDSLPGFRGPHPARVAHASDQRLSVTGDTLAPWKARIGAAIGVLSVHRKTMRPFAPPVRLGSPVLLALLAWACSSKGTSRDAASDVGQADLAPIADVSHAADAPGSTDSTPDGVMNVPDAKGADSSQDGASPEAAGAGGSGIGGAGAGGNGSGGVGAGGRGQGGSGGVGSGGSGGSGPGGTGIGGAGAGGNGSGGAGAGGRGQGGSGGVGSGGAGGSGSGGAGTGGAGGVDGGTFSCGSGSLSCVQGIEYCTRRYWGGGSGGVGPPPVRESYYCVPFPPECASEPNCACLKARPGYTSNYESCSEYLGNVFLQMYCPGDSPC